MSVSRHQLGQALQGAVVLWNLQEVGKVVKTHYDTLLVKRPGVFIDVVAVYSRESVRGVSLNGLRVYLSLPPPLPEDDHIIATVGGIRRSQEA